MTNIKKCDTCRSRKLRCDEALPSCGPCKISGRQCHYFSRKAHLFVTSEQRPTLQDGLVAATTSESRQELPKADPPVVSPIKFKGTLVLRSRQVAKSGKGMFQTFVPIHPGKKDSTLAALEDQPLSSDQSDAREENWSLPRDPYSSSPITIQRKKWLCLVEILSEGFDTMWILGDWMELVVQRIGSSEVIDLATDCLFQSSAAYTNRTEENMSKIYVSNAKALRSLRSAIIDNDPEILRNDVLMSISLLRLVEVFVPGSVRELRVHQNGLLSLLQRISERGTKCNEVMRRIYFSCVNWDFNPAIAQGRDSMFDELSWHALTPPKVVSLNPFVSDLNTAFEYINHRWLIIPRLFRLARNSCSSSADTSIGLEAMELAKKLYDENLDAWIENIFQLGVVKIIPTSDPDCQLGFMKSFEFHSLLAYLGCLTYWLLRIVTYKVIFILLDSLPAVSLPHSFDKSKVAAETLKAAEYIGMSAEHSIKSATVIPLSTIVPLLPLQVSFGAWHELELHAGGDLSDTLDAIYARRMKHWVVSITTRLREYWNYGDISYDALLQRYEFIMGNRKFQTQRI